MSNDPYCVWCNRIGHEPTDACRTGANGPRPLDWQDRALAAEARLAEAEKVIDAAAMMANVCFNAKDSDKVPENVRTWLANTQEAFDKARDAFRRVVEG